MSGVVRPTGTVTFLFTDIEGSTRRWEADPEAMRVELAAHDDVLRGAIEAHGGWLFKHTGDGVCAAFSSPRGAVDAAIDAQRTLTLPVRMGIATGEVEQRGDDYFGPALNRTARVMAVGHGGQVLVSASTAGIVTGFDLCDLGEHRLRDLSGLEHLFQVRADGLASEFPPLRTIDAVPGNLPRQATSFVGRDVEVKELIELVRAHELVTLTGVGGVGKTRLAIQVAAELVPEFPDGVWLVELAPVGDPASVPDAVATALGITQQPGRTVTQSIAEALAGRPLLVVVDNCEHVLDAAGDLVEAILARASTVKVMATSREGLRVGAEHLWPVPSLDVRADTASGAVELFVDRAAAVRPGFNLADPVDANAVVEICRRLDGIALAIELAAARMVSMSPVDVRDRLGDRFRLLSGSRRGLERHQTLRQTVQWSYDLLSDDERTVLQHCSVFAGGFDLAALKQVGDRFDDYTVLDLLDSLVRKSLVALGRAATHGRYALLETIRQFAEDQLVATGSAGEVRERHARYFAAQTLIQWDAWNGPHQRVAADWLDVEFDNLRAGFRWAVDRSDVVTAATIAAHVPIMAHALNRFEPVGWAEELLPAAVGADIAHLPRLYAGAACCVWPGRPEDGLRYAEAALDLEADPRYVSFEVPWSTVLAIDAHVLAGRMERAIEMCDDVVLRPGVHRIWGLVGQLFMLPVVGRSAEARAIADEALAAARTFGNPYWIALAVLGHGRALADTEPVRALDTLHQALAYAREHRLDYFEAVFAREAAGLEAAYGDIAHGLVMFDQAIDSFHQGGNLTNVAVTLAELAKFLDRFDRSEIAATLYGSALGEGGDRHGPRAGGCRRASAFRARRPAVRRVRGRGRSDGAPRSREVRARAGSADPLRSRGLLMTGVSRPSGTVTFLFTDIEGSTRRWEADPESMSVELAAHDGVLRAAVESHGGWLFKHTGDGVCAAFSSPRGAVDAAIDAQRALTLPVRMGVATGEVEQRGDDYFGPALNRTARVMAVGHGGQVLVSASTAGIVTGFDLQDLGEHRLRDLSGLEHLFQVCADGLATEFPPLRTIDAVPGNLPVQVTSFVGRDVEVKELIDLVRAHRLVTLTGVGGVGKTRLAVQVAAELVPEFPDGVWLVELAPIGDPAAVPDAVAASLGIIQQAGTPLATTIAHALGGRRMLIVLDNCEHVLDAAADLIETILADAPTVKVIATSREGVRLPAEHLWPVPSLDVADGVGSGAVALFVERACAVKPGFSITDPADAEAVTEICRRLDGIALAIELAAARMVSMGVQDVRDRLGDRFRLLSGSRRGLERHQTLRQAVSWSYDLLSDDERAVLQHCSVFAGGFDLASATTVCERFDEYALLDLFDSLVRKSLMTVESSAGHARYGLLETIRQFAEDELAASGTIPEVRDRHARWFADQATAKWEDWDGPRQRAAFDWVDVEFDNLRAGFRWAADRNDLVTAVAIAAHVAFPSGNIMRYEPVGWAEEILAAATSAEVEQLPRLYMAASFCVFLGRTREAVTSAQTACRLETDPRYSGFSPGVSPWFEAVCLAFDGQLERAVEICERLVAEQAFMPALVYLAWLLPVVGQTDKAMEIADDAVAAARARGNASMVAFALVAGGRAFLQADPSRALDSLRNGLAYTREHRLVFMEGIVVQDLAGLEAAHGDIDRALDLFDTGIDAFHRGGAVANVAAMFAALAVSLDRLGQSEIAATVYGAADRLASIVWVVADVAGAVEHLRAVLGTARFQECVAAGAAMELSEAVRYSREQIRLVKSDIGASS